MTERLDRILSHHGFGTRKDAKRLLGGGRVSVNGQVVRDASFHLNPDEHELCVDGERVVLKESVYIMMNKKAGFVCANRDGAHSTVFDLLSDEYRHDFLGGTLHLVGRLDIDTEGLLILTTDGTMTHRLLSPKSHVEKAYFVRLEFAVPPERQKEIQAEFGAGIFVEREGNEPGFTAQPARVEFRSEREAILTICEGKYHQVKRMFSAAGNCVSYLKRVRMGGLTLDESLAPGEYRELSADEIGLLK